MASQLIGIDIGVESIPVFPLPDSSQFKGELIGVENVPQFFLDSSHFFALVLTTEPMPAKTIINII